MITKKRYQSMKSAIRRVLNAQRTKNISGIAVFGVNDKARLIIEICREYDRKVECILDNDMRLQGAYYYGTVVKPVSYKVEDMLVFIYSDSINEMKLQLETLKCHNVVDLSSKWENTELYRIYQCEKGSRIYRSIKKKYPRAEIMICPYSGMGDIYLVGSFINEYLVKNDIKEYVFVVINNVCKKVAELFELSNILIMSSEDVECVLRSSVFMPDKIRVHIMNDCFVHTNMTFRLRGYNGLNFADMFRIGVFDLDKNVNPQIPKITWKSNEINAIRKDYEIEDGRSIMISPYSNTLQDISFVFWERVVEKLGESGYQVFTNCNGSSEQPINGTRKISFTVDIAIPLLNLFYAFIGIRSGFCDVISSCKCKKIIIYGKRDAFFAGLAFDYFSLNRIGFSNDAKEILYDNDNDKCEKEIISLLN